MIEILIRGLADYVGPGDIVGAFTNEVKIDSNKIGNIDIKNEIAFVEIAEDVVDKVVEIMDGNQIAGVEVDLELNDGFRKKLSIIENYTDKYKELVQLEREEEMKRHEREIENLSGYEREKKGRAILHLRGRDEGQGLGGKFLIKFMRHYKGEQLPDNEISIGDLVMLSKNEPLNDNNPTGTVVEKTKYSITIVFDNQPANFVYGKGLRLDLYVNDITFQRMLDALEKIKTANGRLATLRDKLLGFLDLEFDLISEVEFFNQNLNSSQKQAVKKALAAQDCFLVHGPPGTGKTMTAIEILEQGVRKDKEILATAASNTAVDNLVERLVNRGLDVLRIGHPVRVNSMLREYTLDYVIEDHPKYQKATELRNKAYDLLDKQDQYTHPSGRWRRGMSNSQIKKLAKEGKGSRGVSLQKIKEMAKWLGLQKEIDSLFGEVEKLEDKAVRDLINQADVVCTTNSTAGSEILDNKGFDLLVVDEATQASEPSTLIPLIKAKKVILAGDHKQLPPTILNKEAKEKGLAKTLFERLIDLYGKDIKEVLKLQYRMNKNIMSFSSKEFYASTLKAAPEVADWSLKDLNLALPTGNTPAEKVLSQNQVISFLDTCGMEASEYSKKDSTSVQNRIEAELSAEIVAKISNASLNLTEVAIITPYQDQVELINKLVRNDKVEVNTVDGFQGREKEVIILSLVRSNNKGDIGFLSDLRRLNVSLTRAKKELIIIGDTATILNHSTYKRLVDYIKEHGYYYDL